MQPPAKAAVAVEYSYLSYSHSYSCSSDRAKDRVRVRGLYLEQTQRPQALVKVRLPDGRGNFVAWKTETIRTSGTFCFDDPKCYLRQFFFHLDQAESGKIKIQDAFRLSRELFCHQRLSAGDGSPIDMTLGFAVNR